MKRLLRPAFYTLVFPALFLVAACDQSQQPDSQAMDQDMDQDRLSASASAADQGPMGDPSDPSPLEHRGYMATAPSNTVPATHLIDAEVITLGDEDIGSVQDLVIDEAGQIVAVVVGVGGFLGMSEKIVAIDWQQVTRFGTSENVELRADVTREDLREAPQFVPQDGSPATPISTTPESP